MSHETKWPEIGCGCTGTNVRALQFLLNNEGYTVAADADFGPITETAIKMFQQSKNLTIDGIAGKNTLSAIVADVAYQQNSFLVKAAQTLLRKFEPVIVDGDFGPDSKESTEQFQRKTKLSVTGKIEIETWKYLFAYECYPQSDVNNSVTAFSVEHILTGSQLERLKNNMQFYKNAAAKYNMPWQVLAAIHYREYSLIKAGPNNGNGPYQIWGRRYKCGPYSDLEFQNATNDAAAFVRSKVGSIDLYNDNNVKLAFFRYNGVAQVYIQQAIKLGFDNVQAKLGEGSPYVMNRFDAKRDPTIEPTKSNNTWGQIKNDCGAIEYPANSDYGAFTLFKIL